MSAGRVVRSGAAALRRVVAPASVRVADLLCALGARDGVVALAPASVRGWHSGRTILAWQPCARDATASLADLAGALERGMSASGPHLVAALASYDGESGWAAYDGYLERTDQGWVLVGDAPADLGEVCGAAARAGHRDPPSGALIRQGAWDLRGRDFRAAVDEARRRIAAGDVYVLNLTVRIEGAMACGPAAAFASMLGRASADMSAFAAGLAAGAPWIASVSPERFLRVRVDDTGMRTVETQPIKGTRPRGATPEQDACLAAELLGDEKERAEHVMVVDLERNDLGAVCQPGSVVVEPLYELVATPYCHQLVSTVRGVMRPDAGLADLLASAFPGGSVTGAPKRAAMRAIADLEASPRAAYCGALLVARAGDLDSSVLIRTLEGADANGGRGRYGTGCGITFDSDPVAEELEALLKASPVLGDAPPPVALRETMRLVDGAPPHLARHLARLARGGAGPATIAAVVSAVAEKLAEAPARSARRLGVTVTPDGSVACGLADEPSSLEVGGGPRIACIEIPAAPLLPPGAAKPAARRFWDRAHAAARMAGADQAVLHLPDGTLVDGSTANVWLVRHGALLTPPAPPAVAGVAREVVFDLARRLGIDAVERQLSLEDLDAAEEVVLSNAVGGVVAVRDRGGPVADALAEGWAATLAASAR